MSMSSNPLRWQKWLSIVPRPSVIDESATSHGPRQPLAQWAHRCPFHNNSLDVYDQSQVEIHSRDSPAGIGDELVPDRSIPKSRRQNLMLYQL